MQNVAAGPDGRAFIGGLRGCGRNVLELESHDVDIGSEASYGRQIVVMRRDLDVGHLARGRVTFRRECMDAVTHPARGYGEHAAQLAATQNADDGTWKDRLKNRFHEAIKSCFVAGV
jgi:hypothetical protein